jgi:hypothetical protein
MKVDCDREAAASKAMSFSGRAMLAAAVVLTVLAFFWSSRPLGAQELYTGALGFDQGVALGRALYPDESESQVLLADPYSEKNQSLAPYNASNPESLLPGLESLASQSARDLLRRKALEGSDAKAYSLAEAMEDALWRKRVVETFWGIQD